MILEDEGERKTFAGKVFTLLSDSVTVTDAWGYYLFDEKDDAAQHLRIMASTIWFCALYDSIEARDRVLPEYKQTADENGFTSFRLIILSTKRYELNDAITLTTKFLLNTIHKCKEKYYFIAKKYEIIFSQAFYVLDTVEALFYYACSYCN